MTDHSPDPSDAYERPEVFDLTPNAMTATQPWETDGTSLALTAASLLNELRPLVAAALDWDDARRTASAAPANDTAWRQYVDAADEVRMHLLALSEDAHVWARGEALVDSMEHKQEAADALDAFRSLRRVALAELINTTGRSL